MTTGSSALRDLVAKPGPLLALAPMQDVTDLEFWRLMARYGGADLYYTEFFRVHSASRLEKWILRSITENPTGRPVVAQMIGNDIPAMIRTATELAKHDVAAIDLNLGCPAPVVYKKCAGGGLLRDPERVDRILGSLREAISIPFTVKTRLGFDTPEVFEKLLPIFARHNLDLLTVHGRTVKEMYWSEVHYDAIARAVAQVPCPVLANGNVHSAAHAMDILGQTGARGLMIGRGAIRNPWIFEQIRQYREGLPVRLPMGREVLNYIEELYAAVVTPTVPEVAQVMKMKKYMNFLGVGVDEKGEFLHRIRRVDTKMDFFHVCRDHLAHDHPMPLIPFPVSPAGPMETGE